MKTKSFFNMLLVMIIGFGACKDDDKKTGSAECDIIHFRVGEIEYQKEGLNITHMYPKTGVDQWASAPTGKVAPAIEFSPKATIQPLASVAQDFFAEGGVKYTVTAEDGKTAKVYTVKATKVATYP